ncbi:hypothetical protein E0H39_29705 [Rhizobium leguminosarum bv. viciae]|uniref:cytochrome-c peroxidase n=1 Tax=Rhizobium leguminosarum TaxID=384 RepID=UPI001039B913|nr:cytochrome c peroxidase [Rhizobium leguminosarum]TBY57683.1 hypothetical protein E0H39_29705 [Rhizobium leguminosarum bv. viciae]
MPKLWFCLLPAALALLSSQASDVDACELAALGERLFSERNISLNALSCSGCHRPDMSYQDGEERPVGRAGLVLPRNTPSLQHVLLYTSYGWDGRNPTLQDRIKEVLLAPTEINASEESLGLLISDACPGALNERDNKAALALAVSALTRYVENIAGSSEPWTEQKLSPDQRRGYQIFKLAGCAVCHPAPTFTDDSFHDIALERRRILPQTSGLTSQGQNFVLGIDYGRGNVVSGKEAVYAFRTPTLLDVTHTAPFMHDGRFHSLREVVDFFQRQKDLGLTNDDERLLIDFISSLSSTAKGGP